MVLQYLSRKQLRLIIEGLDKVREDRRAEHKDDPASFMADPEYNRIFDLQDHLITHLESLPY